MRLRAIEIDERLKVKFDKTIVSSGDNVSGYMKFGENNDYPQICEKLISGSVTAKSASDVYAKFLVGSGFEDERINSIIVGRDSRNKQITILSMLRQCSQQVAYHNGFYIHANFNLQRKIVDSKLVPFKNCRFNKADDLGYCSKIGVYDNWQKDKDAKFDKNKVSWYPIFNTNETAFNSIVGENGIDGFKGMIYFQFLDNQFFYPLSPFDASYLDIDTEQQVSIFKSRTIRSGFSKKTIFLIAAENEDEFDKIEGKIKSMMGADGDQVAIFEADVDTESGKINKESNITTMSIDSSIDDKLFENWEKNISNNIRKSIKALPAILIDYEESKLGNTSGEAITQATNFYNAMTQDDRALISESFKEIYSQFAGGKFEGITNWNIKPLNLTNDNTTQILPAARYKADKQ